MGRSSCKSPGTQREHPETPLPSARCVGVFRACVPRLLEGLSEAVLRFVSNRLLLRDLRGRASLLPAGQLRTGHRLVDSVTGEPVDSSNKARGYEIGENQFLLVEDRP
jgi:hypothetical protein